MESQAHYRRETIIREIYDTPLTPSMKRIIQRALDESIAMSMGGRISKGSSGSMPPAASASGK